MHARLPVARDGWGYAVFGKVTQGMEVVQKIAKVATSNAGMHQNVPLQPASIRGSSRSAHLPGMRSPPAEDKEYHMIKLHTSHGVITLELDADKAPADRPQLPRLRGRRPLRQHGVPPRHRRLHDPGRRLRARHEAEADPAPIKNEADNGLKNDAAPSPWRAPPTRIPPPPSSSSTSSDNDFLDHPRPTGQGWGYCVFGRSSTAWTWSTRSRA